MEIYFIPVHSHAGNTQKMLMLVTSKVTNEWIERAEKLNNPRVYHNIDGYNKFDEIFECVDRKFLAGAGDIKVYRAKRRINNCEDIIAIVNEPYLKKCDANFFTWHEVAGRYWKKLIPQSEFNNYYVNVGTLRNEKVITLKELLKL